METYNAVVKLRHREIVSYDPANEPVYQTTFENRIWLEGFTTQVEAVSAGNCALRGNPDVVVKAWVQISGEIPDETKAVCRTDGVLTTSLQQKETE